MASVRGQIDNVTEQVACLKYEAAARWNCYAQLSSSSCIMHGFCESRYMHVDSDQ